MTLHAALSSRRDRAGIFLDFDGSLSEIAETPGEAVAVQGVARVLERLAERFAVVGIVTGRRLADIEQKLGRPAGVRLFGLYGLERDAEAGAPAAPAGSGGRAVEEILPRVRELAAEVPGCLVEPKGTNIAVHYRLAPDPDEARERLLRDLEPLAGAAGLVLIEGKRVVELAPSGAPSKGDVLAREARGLEAVLYAGDDLADLEAFAALDALAESGSRTVKVAVRSPGTPAELLSTADVVAEGPEGLLAMLEELAR